MGYVFTNGAPTPALPKIQEFLSIDFCDRIFLKLKDIEMLQFESSVCVTRDVSRIPLKLDALDDAEESFLNASNDGLRFLECLDIHDFNVQSREGLIRTLRELQVCLLFRWLYLFLVTRRVWSE